MRIVIKIIKINLIMLLCMVLSMQDLWAFKINLIESTLDLGKGMKSTTATVINDGESMIAIEATARVRSFSQDGEEHFDKEAENLIIVPSQMIIAPGGEQILNIRWVAGNNIQTEEAYRLLIEYVPISEDQLQGNEAQIQKAGIDINYRIAKSFYVTPKNTKPNVVLDNVDKIMHQEKEALKFSFANTGSKHQIVPGFDVQFITKSGESIPVSFTQADLGKSINFLAKEKRDILVFLPEILVGQEIADYKLTGLHE